MEIIEHSNKELNEKNNQNKKIWKKIIIIFTIIIFFVLGVLLTYWYSKKNPMIITKNKTVSEIKVSEEVMEDAIEKIYDSVICIEVLNQNGDTLSTGTGFVYGKSEKYGYVLTNAHVISSGNIVKGVLSNNDTVELTVLGTDSYTDLAVLRMDVNKVLQIAQIGDSKNTKIGNTVFTVGSPMGSKYAGTVTKGILSGKDRLIETSASNSNMVSAESYIVKVLQTDAAISPGNSGGPLVNLAGEVIGITSLKLVDEQVEGMGFAIPIEDAMNYVNILEKGEKIKRPLIGVQILDLTNKYTLYRYGINIDSSIKSGIILMSVSENSSASDAGLKDGDIITKIDDKDIDTVSEFKYELYRHSIGDTIEVTYYRNGKMSSTKLKLNKSSE